MCAQILVGMFILCLIFSVPIAISLGIASLVFNIFLSPVPVDLTLQAYFSGLDSFSLLAVPFFMLAGDIMLAGGISKRLVNLGTTMMRKVPGSLGLITVVCCAIFAAISGSGPATVAAIGGLMIPYMVKNGYDKGFACSLAACSGSLGPIIPPSICFVMYGIIANVSITDMFTAGVVPGLLMALFLMIFVLIVARRNGYTAVTEDDDMKNVGFFRALWDAKWAVLSPVVILGGIYGGIFTPTEAAVIACDYGLIVGIFIYKEIKLEDIFGILRNTAVTCGSCIILVSTATAFGRILTMEQIPTLVSNAIINLSDNKIVLLLAINVLLLIVGMFMETLSAMIVLTPLLLAIVTPLGYNPIQFGVMMTINLAIGQCTPPVGTSLFIATRIAGIRIDQSLKWLYICIGVLLIPLLMVTFIPQITLCLL